MKRIMRDREKFGGIDLLFELGITDKLGVDGDTAADSTIQRFIDVLNRSKTNPTLLHGRRVQAMFAYVVSSLGCSVAIKEEDAGEFYTVYDGIRPPDYRIILENGDEFLAEVKNYHPKNPKAPLRIKETYLKSLLDYARLFKKDLKLAIYWSRWGLWTLINADKLVFHKGVCSITMPKAMVGNEMYLLGDSWIGTVAPLIVRLCADSGKPQLVKETELEFTVGSIEIYGGGKKITDDLERKLAYYFINYSDWVVSGPEPVVKDGQLICLEVVARPQNTGRIEDFDILALMSQMMSRRYNDLTTSEAGITALTPRKDLDLLSARIPKDHICKDLRLCSFVGKPAGKQRLDIGAHQKVGTEYDADV